jgi:hypothetical protein
VFWGNLLPLSSQWKSKLCGKSCSEYRDREDKSWDYGEPVGDSRHKSEVEAIRAGRSWLGIDEESREGYF